MSQNRQLSAIMFTDIVGYTALMDEDEELAMQLLDKNRTIHNQMVTKHQGKLVKEIGDGNLACFASASDAVFCAINIQKECSVAQNLQLRIGIHEGEIIFQNNDVFGSGVNIASRLEQAAPAGGIYISENVFRSIANRKEIKTSLISEQLLKNVKHPLKIYEIKITEAESAGYQEVASSNTPYFGEKPMHSLVVLPFSDMSLQRDQEYLGDGLADEIITLMSQIKELKVIGRTSSFSFKKKEVDLKMIGKLLNATVILEGSIQRISNRVRVNVHLVNAADGCDLWSERYDREINDLFEIQDDISSKITEKLKLSLLTSKEDKPRKTPSNMHAYELLLRGRFHAELWVSGFSRAIEYYKRAVELDTEYIEAYCSLAKCYFQSSIFLFLNYQEDMETASAYVKKALALDPTHFESHMLMAHIHFWYDWNWKAAEAELKKAKEHPDLDFRHDLNFEAWYRALIYGEFDFAIQDLEKKVALDPLYLDNLLQLGQFKLFNRQYAEARTVLHQLLAENPTHSEACRYIGQSYLCEQRYDKALEYMHKAVEYSQGRGWSTAWWIMTLAQSGDQKQAEELFEQQKQNPLTSKFPTSWWILINSYLGHIDEAFRWLEQSFTTKNFWMTSLKYVPDWDPMRNDPRFNGIIERMHFPSHSFNET